MNRQARLKGAKDWTSYGNVTFFEAIKAEAKRAARRNNMCEWIWVVECRCESEPDRIEEYEVQVTLHAEVLNPRKGE